MYTQVEAMCTHYDMPILLIEFDPDKAFTMTDIKLHATGNTASQPTIMNKLVQFAVTFPKLRIIWSVSQ